MYDSKGFQEIDVYMKQDYRMARNFLKGINGDAVNVLLAAAIMNFKRMMDRWKKATHFLANIFFASLSSFELHDTHVFSKFENYFLRDN